MSKCETCRQYDVFDTPYEKFTQWLFVKLFPKHYTDLSEEKYTKGFGEGFKAGMKSSREDSFEYGVESKVDIFKRNVERYEKPATPLVSPIFIPNDVGTKRIVPIPKRRNGSKARKAVKQARSIRTRRSS